MLFIDYPNWRNRYDVMAASRWCRRLRPRAVPREKGGPPTTHQKKKYAHFSLLSSWLRLCINITYIQITTTYQIWLTGVSILTNVNIALCGQRVFRFLGRFPFDGNSGNLAWKSFKDSGFFWFRILKIRGVFDSKFKDSGVFRFSCYRLCPNYLNVMF
jgi:hypothetical protein